MMSLATYTTRRRPPALLVAMTVAVALALGLVSDARAEGSADTLPLGDPDLAETRSTQELAAGVTLTRIVRGTEPAQPDQINTTSRGPWRVHVLSIDPDIATGHLQATYGPDLARVEKTTDLVRLAGALAGVNASFFTFAADPEFPGDPVGLGLYDGELLSEPTSIRNEADLVVNANTDKVLMGHLTWSGEIRNQRSGKRLPLEFLNHPPVVPAGCADLVDQTRCNRPGDLVHFDPEFGAATPSGRGVEVVLDQRGCVVRTTMTRGQPLTAEQTSLQATGSDAGSLLNLTKRGCLDRSVTLSDQSGEQLPLQQGMFGVNGRYQLTANGRIVVPDGSGSFFDRNPRTIAGTTSDGKIMLVTIDGRQATSVGTTMEETAAVADALGMHTAVNLDGGGSTAMSVDGDLVNQPSGTTERAVGDALVYVDAG